MTTKLAPATALAADVPVVDLTTGQPARRAAIIDGLRAVACFMVIASHSVTFSGFGGLYFRDWTEGAGGVALFFVISGYLIAGPFLHAVSEHRPLPGRQMYLMRRAARILPAWWLAFAVAVVALALCGRLILSGGSILAHLTLTQFFFPSLGYQKNSPLSVGWTLCLEAAFYVLVPLVATILHRRCPDGIPVDRLAAYLCAGWLISLVFGEIQEGMARHRFLVLPFHALEFDVLTARYLGLFVPGMLVYLMMLPSSQGTRLGRLFDYLRTRPSIPGIAGLLMLASVLVLRRSSHLILTSLDWPLLSISMGSLLLVALTWSRPAIKGMQWLARLGLLTYGLYLYHFTIAAVLTHYGVRLTVGSTPVISAVLTWLAASVGLLMLTVPFALASWLMVEKPLIRRAALHTFRTGRGFRRHGRAEEGS